MTSCFGKSYKFGLLYVDVYQFVCVFLSVLVLNVKCRI